MYLIYKGLCTDGTYNYLNYQDGEIQCNTIEEGNQMLLSEGIHKDELNQYGFEKI